MRVLVADDDATTRRFLTKVLEGWGHEVVAVSDGPEALEALEGRDAPQLALLDWMMEDLDGPDVCRSLRAREGAPYVYAILVTSRSEKQDVITGLESGADDYLTKPINVSELRARMRAGERILELQRELIEARETEHFRATHDSLTELLNRAAFLSILKRELSRAEREKTPVAVAIADIDHFKAVNDTHGHAVGDMVLVEAARRLWGGVRLYDTIARYGGEEFAFVFPGCDEEKACSVADRLRRSLSSRPIDTSTGSVDVTVSIGLAIAGDTFDPDSLIDAADAALYRAKEEGRDRVVSATSSEVETEGGVTGADE